MITLDGLQLLLKLPLQPLQILLRKGASAGNERQEAWRAKHSASARAYLVAPFGTVKILPSTPVAVFQGSTTQGRDAVRRWLFPGLLSSRFSQLAFQVAGFGTQLQGFSRIYPAGRERQNAFRVHR